MSNLPLNPHNITGPPHTNANSGSQLNHNVPNSQVPLSQLPPGFGGMKQDANSNSPLPPIFPSQNSVLAQGNNYNQSASSSPAFNNPGTIPPYSGLPPTLRAPVKPVGPLPNQNPSQSPLIVPLASNSPRKVSSINPSPTLYTPNFQPHLINDNAPPLIPSIPNQPLMNGPPIPGPAHPNVSQRSQYPVSSSAFAPPISNRPPVSTASFGQGSMNMPLGHQGPLQGAPIVKLPGPSYFNSPNVTFSGPHLSGPPGNSPLTSGSTVSGPPNLGRPTTSGPQLDSSISGPPTSGPPISTGPLLGHSISGVPLGPPQALGVNGPSNFSGPPVSGPIMGQPKGPGIDLSSGVVGRPLMGPLVSGPSTTHPTYMGTQNNGPPMGSNIPGAPQSPYMGYRPMGPSGPPIGPQLGPQSAPPGPSTGPMPGPPRSNMQGRYPQMAPSNYPNQPQATTVQPQPNMGQQYPHQYQGVTQQMGQLSVTKQGFDQLWGHQMLDLMTCRNILPEYPEDPPEIKLGHQFADSPNCSSEIFRCTINRIPESNALLQKSRLPLGILIHPFKDLNHLPVIQCTTIVRCRACRTYINPFVYFVDAKRWKCNLCYRVNDLPEEFQYDPVSKSYGDPSRRPEIKSATIEFIAPGEYMLRPPQPAVYLFLMDVSQIARESGYLQVLCETLKTSLDKLPGDARTQVGFICFDAHIHYYLMSDGLTRPKEMTVLDIDDVFLPSPESLLVNLGERRELIMELLSVLPQRYSGTGIGAPACALGAALQAAYKLMAPTGGRITVFQTCLPNMGPGALQSREDPNGRSANDVPHLNPATDFYKRLALDCSGAQIAVDLFVLSSQYSDIATLSGMSKFSGGTVYHLPLFKAEHTWQATQLTRILQRYLTRKIGFESVMRVRCTRGIAIHTFHGNFFVRSTDLLSLPNVSPDAGFGMQLTIEESLSDVQQACFQAALLYTSSKGERRIRVHTLALPIANSLTDVLHSADQQCIVALLAKMAVDRCASATMVEAREALINVAVDALSAHRLAQNLPAGAAGNTLYAPASLRMLPLYLIALLKRMAFRTGISTRLDDRVADMCNMKTLPLPQLIRLVYPDLYPIHTLRSMTPRPEDDEVECPDPPRLQLSAERINSNGAYLLDDGETMIIYVCQNVSAAFLSETFGVCAFNQVPDEGFTLPRLETDGNVLLHAFIDRLNDDRPYASHVIILRDNSSKKKQFTGRLVEDRIESAFSYYEFLQHIRVQVK